jgi:mRNA-degrading endonuclease RelE of RelBE toxin-antitoxin system
LRWDLLAIGASKVTGYITGNTSSAIVAPDDRPREAIPEIALAPTAWPVIRGTGGARKARAARGGRGKSGGVRIIYFVVNRRGVIYLIDIYAKSEKEDLTDAEIREIRKLAVALEAEG